MEIEERFYSLPQHLYEQEMSERVMEFSTVEVFDKCRCPVAQAALANAALERPKKPSRVVVFQYSHELPAPDPPASSCDPRVTQQSQVTTAQFQQIRDKLTLFQKPLRIMRNLQERLLRRVVMIHFSAYGETNNSPGGNVVMNVAPVARPCRAVFEEDMVHGANFDAGHLMETVPVRFPMKFLVFYSTLGTIT
jgi:hypothetical protein